MVETVQPESVESDKVFHTVAAQARGYSVEFSASHAFGRSEDDWAFASQIPRWMTFCPVWYTISACPDKRSGPPGITAGICIPSDGQV